MQLVVTLLKTDPVFDQRLLVRMLFLVSVLSLTAVRSQLPIPPSGNLPHYAGNSLTEIVFRSKLNNCIFQFVYGSLRCPASTCTSELRNEGINQLQLYNIVFISTLSNGSCPSIESD